MLLKTIGFSCVCISVIRFESCLLARTGNNAQWMSEELSNNNHVCIEYKSVNRIRQIILSMQTMTDTRYCHLQIRMNNVR